MKKGKVILISRDPRKNSILGDFAKKNALKLIEQSFIDTTVVKGHDIPKTDWIFITSPRGGKCFFDAYSGQLSGKEKLACLGPATAKQMKKKGFLVSFVGNPDHSTQTIAEQFKNAIRDETVLFPLSQLSKKNISSVLPKEQRVELVCYETTPIKIKVDTADIFIVTSPSNFRGYLLGNKVPDETVLICYGDTTEAAIREETPTNEVVNIQSTKQEKLVETIERFIYVITLFHYSCFSPPNFMCCGI